MALTILIVSAYSITAYAKSKAPYNPDKAYAEIDKSIEGITTYKEYVEKRNSELANEIIDGVLTTITISSPANFDEIAYYVLNYDISIVQIQLRGIAPDGTRITVFSRTDKGLEETEKILLEQARVGGYELIGVIGMNVLVNSDRLIDLQADSLTYLADTSSDRYFKGSNNISSGERNNLDEVNRGKLFPQSLYWDLEDLNIIDTADYNVIDSISDRVSTSGYSE